MQCALSLIAIITKNNTQMPLQNNVHVSLMLINVYAKHERVTKGYIR